MHIAITWTNRFDRALSVRTSLGSVQRVEPGESLELHFDAVDLPAETPEPPPMTAARGEGPPEPLPAATDTCLLAIEIGPA